MVDYVTWTGATGQTYSMELCRFGFAFARNPGVYIFCKPGTIVGRWSQIYVGETEDFNDRLNINLANHHQWACITRQGATNVCALVVTGGKVARTTIEADLRAALNPPCNQQ